MCPPRVIRHISIRYSSSCHTRVNMSASIFLRHGSLQQLRISIHPYWRVCSKNLNIVSMCAVSHVVNTSNISSCQKKTFSVFLWLWTIPLRFGLLVINVCNHGEHYEMPRMYLFIYTCILYTYLTWRAGMGNPSCVVITGKYRKLF
jgi:hypothetical protein